jgi:excinuclease ABC A subunit
MQSKDIFIKGARENNLKNISVSIPRNQITCLVGVSGSGKSSLAYNIIYSEGQRQFLESVNTFAARLLKRTQRPDVDEISNLSPTISIDQKRLKGSPRSTVGTTTEIYTYLRLLFSRFGTVHNLSAGHFSFNNPHGACPQCKGLGTEFTLKPEDIADFSKSLSEGAVNHNNYKPGKRLYNILATSKRLDMNKKLSEYRKEELDFLFFVPRVELSNSENGFIQRFSHEGILTRLIKRAGDLRGTSERKEKTDKPYLTESVCRLCNGSRLNQKALQSLINGQNIGYYSTIEISKLYEEVKKIDYQGSEEIVKRISENLNFLIKVKLDYLSLNRSLDTLSGGEAQRLKLARELGNSLIELIYIFDEPTAGLHNRDRENIVSLIKQIRDSNNTVILIEHNKEVMQSSDNIIEIGKSAGKQGGEIVFEGTYDQLISNKDSITSYYLNLSPKPKQIVRIPKDYLKIENISINNLKSVSTKVPLGVMCTFTGVSGSGKSSLLIDAFAKKYKENVIVVDQSPLQGTSRGNCATYVGVFDKIRELIAKKNHVSKEIFSFNGKGACPECKGLGYKKIDMHFMGDVTVKCDTCFGKRYKEEILLYLYKDLNIDDILGLTVKEAFDFFEDIDIKQQLETLISVGLDYIELGQSHDTFSGGEAQRLKLAKQLQKKGQIYILDEPTSGLHYADIEKLLKLLNQLVDNGNTVLAVEHNMTFIAQSDWIIDLGPEGGNKGGYIVAEGTPQEVSHVKQSYTGNYLAML